MIVYLPEDEIALKVGDVTLYVSPLTSAQQDKLAQYVRQHAGKKEVDHKKTVTDTLRWSVKRLGGVKRPDGSTVELESRDGQLTDKAMEILYRLGMNTELVNIATHLFTMQEEKLSTVEGVEVQSRPGVPVKKKAK